MLVNCNPKPSQLCCDVTSCAEVTCDDVQFRMNVYEYVGHHKVGRSMGSFITQVSQKYNS